ncbi:MAG: 16S rRNA (adenine(1518)-N(6)/adenine(1519)-N(6))-dimethyltransferase RsmA [bacterium]|nr:16S rRNA (adenine(1518)-N(6)/adenine(1519)-N(6))-dimethyltransferase RsmA [bacterium]
MIFAKKSLGQNFLKDKSALDAIIEAGKISNEDIILEIGPGEGALTSLLLAKAGKVIAVEKDDRLIPILKEKFSKEIGSGKLELIHEDILNTQIKNLNLEKGEYKIIANIPYYITGELTRIFLESDFYPNTIVFLVQKEVAERIIDEKGSILSVSIKAYGTPEYIKTVKAGSFVPAPNVDSAILAIYDISKKQFETAQITEKDFFTVVKTGFAHKRKILSSNLKELFDPDKIETTWTELNIDKNERAEQITIEKWFEITKKLICGNITV